MKFLLLAALVLLPIQAKAYVSADGTDPRIGGYDVEIKSALKSEVALYSDAIVKGAAVFYDENDLAGMYKVSIFNSNFNNVLAGVYQAGIATRAVATGDVAIFGVATGGYVDYALYDAAAPIVVGNYLCIGTAATVKGKLVSCGAGITSGFRSLDNKASGTGSNLRVRINSR